MKKTFSLIALCSVLLLSSLPNVGARQKPGSDALLFAAGQRTSLDVPLSVTISGDPNAADNLYTIVSDGRGAYVDGKDGVYARFQVDNGTNDFIFDPTNTGAKFPRALLFDFSNKIADGTIPNPWPPGFTKIDTYVNFDQVYSVPVGAGESLPKEEKVGGFGQLFTSSTKLTYRVVFNPDTALHPQEVNTPNNTAHLLVSHPTCDTWIIEPENISYMGEPNPPGTGGPVAGLIGSGKTTSSAGQYLMPFQITLKRLTPCP